LLTSVLAGAQTAGHEFPQYQLIQDNLAGGWNTWNTRSVLSHVLLPEGFAVNLAFKQHYWLNEQYLDEALIGRRGEDAEEVRPGPHAWNGSYTRLDIRWEQLNARIESAIHGEDLVILITPLSEFSSPVILVVETGMLWNRPGSLARNGDVLAAVLPARTVNVYATGEPTDDPYVETLTPYLAINLDRPVGISTGEARTVDEIRGIIDSQRDNLERTAGAYGELSEAYLAIQSVIAWNTVYEPKHDRVVSTVGRLWNDRRGGYALFGWDNFFMAYMTSLDNRELAYANVIEHLRGKTEEGFIPNDNQGNGRRSWDRSQPPVGGIMVKEIYKRYPERWFLEAAFDDLLDWNRWWIRRRLNDGLLSYGSHEAQNPFNEDYLQSMVAAGYESGMDDSPMYEGVPFNTETSTMDLQDVGLNSLYIADCEALAEMAETLGRMEEAVELRRRAENFRGEMERLWDQDTGLYLNRRTDTGELSLRFSPTIFYPLLARVPSQERARRIVEEHFFNPDEFWGEWILPSAPRNDPAFERQRYWKGAIWPPLNFLTYLSLREYGMQRACEELAERSLRLLLGEWERHGFVCENYSSITGRGDDPRLSSDRFHSWGALFGIIAFIESGIMPATEVDIHQH